MPGKTNAAGTLSIMIQAQVGLHAALNCTALVKRPQHTLIDLLDLDRVDWLVGSPQRV